MPPELDKEKAMEALVAEIKACKKCPLHALSLIHI